MPTSPLEWIICRCGARNDARYFELPASFGKNIQATKVQVWRACILRGWRGSIDQPVCPSCAALRATAEPAELQEFHRVRVPPEAWVAIWDAIELHQKRPTRENARVLAARVSEYFLSRKCTLSQLFPCLGALYAVFELHRLGRFGLRRVFRAFLWTCRNWFYRGRPGWNDFEMGAWMATHDSQYVQRMLDRWRSTRGMVQESCEWMMDSSAQRDPAFREQYLEVLASNGFLTAARMKARAFEIM